MATAGSARLAKPTLLETQSDRHDQCNERWARRLHAVETVIAVGLPVVILVGVGGTALVWYFVFATAF